MRGVSLDGFSLGGGVGGGGVGGGGDDDGAGAESQAPLMRGRSRMRSVSESSQDSCSNDAFFI
eukprot:3276265-Pleurochrysis_carterae.AAC.1